MATTHEKWRSREGCGPSDSWGRFGVGKEERRQAKFKWPGTRAPLTKRTWQPRTHTRTRATPHVRVVVHVRRSAGPHIRVSTTLSLSLSPSESAFSFRLLRPFTRVELVHILFARIISQSHRFKRRVEKYQSKGERWDGISGNKRWKLTNRPGIFELA